MITQQEVVSRSTGPAVIQRARDSLSPEPVMSILPATPGIHVMKLLHINTLSHPHLRAHTNTDASGITRRILAGVRLELKR